jgi:uncharacterized repeat protein (TIGR03803 family)
MTIVAAAQNAVTFTTLHSFDGTDGSFPEATLVQATDGNLYSTTLLGGAGNGGPAYGGGTAFRITPVGTLTTLHSFCVQSCADGIFPYAGVVQGRDGEFYGTTNQGGADPNNIGTVFSMSSSGAVTTLYSFCSESGCADGSYPLRAPLVEGTDWNFYGVTPTGGTSDACSQGCGTVFKVTPAGVLTTLHSFDGADGSYPDGALIQATDGNLYGTTASGGANSNGTVFRISPSGAYATLYPFCSQQTCTDGSGPEGALLEAADGNLYGTTSYGGTDGYGTVFRITLAGALTVLHSFDSTDGAYPVAGVVQATDGNFYGTTFNGGTSSTCSAGCGTVFTMTPDGALTTLHSFDGTDGANPFAAVVQDTDGTLYGTTNQGGANACNGVAPGGCGTVFSLDVGLGPFVQTEPAYGAVGTIVTILGNNLTGATRVTFNGMAATFQVLSSSEIMTVVPTGATTGIVQVTTPSGTLNSNVAFQVTTQQNAPPVRIASLQETVEALVNVGTINATQGQSLLVPLSEALTELGEGHTPAAILDLLYFIDRVALLTRTSALGAAGGRVLIDAALLIIIGLV